MSHTITLTTPTQVTLFNQELCGQLSDGYWENSSPRDHWKVPCNAEVVLGEEGKVNFFPHRAYNFAAPKLIEYVGDRMMQFCRVSIKFPGLSTSTLDVTDSGDWWWSQNIHNDGHQKNVDKVKAEFKKIGVTNYTEMKSMVDDLDESSYTLKDLRKDLRGINAAFKNRA